MLNTAIKKEHTRDSRVENPFSFIPVDEHHGGDEEKNQM